MILKLSKSSKKSQIIVHAGLGLATINGEVVLDYRTCSVFESLDFYEKKVLRNFGKMLLADVIGNNPNY